MNLWNGAQIPYRPVQGKAGNWVRGTELEDFAPLLSVQWRYPADALWGSVRLVAVS
jgi:hypothetical protein